MFIRGEHADIRDEHADMRDVHADIRDEHADIKKVSRLSSMKLFLTANKQIPSNDCDLSLFVSLQRET